MNFTPQDLELLKAAKGWIELEAWDVANGELESITQQLRTHPDVLKLRLTFIRVEPKQERDATHTALTAQMLEHHVGLELPFRVLVDELTVEAEECTRRAF